MSDSIHAFYKQSCDVTRAWVHKYYKLLNDLQALQHNPP